MHANTRDPHIDFARQELLLVAVILVAIGRFVGSPAWFAVVGLMPPVILVAGSAVLRSDERPGRPFIPLLIPAVLVGGAAAAVHIVPPGLGLVPALGVFALALDRTLRLELRLMVQATGITDSDRLKLVAAAVVAAVIAFTGVACLVPGGLPEPGAAGVSAGQGGGTGTALTPAWLAVIAGVDAVVALLLGFRLAAARYGSATDALRSALTYAIVVAVAAGAIRALEVPRLIGPAALTLVFYLWDAIHATAPARRREPRFLWETILLAILAIGVVAWNINLPG